MWRQKQKPACLKRKREEHEEMLNSSFQVPSYARITNARVKAGSVTHLLTLPEKIRHSIFHFALVEQEAIIVSIKNVEASNEPGLLEVSHDIRAEAIPIFYIKNDFDLQVHDFYAAALVPWLNKTNSYRANAIHARENGDVRTKDQGHDQKPPPNITAFSFFDPAPLTPTQTWMLEKQRIYHSTRNHAVASSIGSIAWTIPFEPNWCNLICWLKLFHAGKLLGPPEDDHNFFDGTTASAEEAAAFAVFDVVAALLDETWDTVEKVLPGLRAMLGAREPLWLQQDLSGERREKAGENMPSE